MGKPILLAEVTLDSDQRTLTAVLSEETSECDFWRVLFENAALNSESLFVLSVNGVSSGSFFGSNGAYKMHGDVGIARGALPDTKNKLNNYMYYLASSYGSTKSNSGNYVQTVTLSAYRDTAVIKAGAKLKVYGYKY